MSILIVAAGGAIGAVCRYGISLIPFHFTFPLATFLTNLIGAFIIGIIVGVAEKEQASDNMILFIKTGFCGGFTTFSTFSLESVELLSGGKYLLGGGYMVASLILCILGVILGKMCVR